MSSLLQLLFVGDIVGQPGRRGFKTILPEVVREHQIDVVVANIENAAGGFGVTLPIYQELLQAGVSCFTSGNHVYDQKKSMGDFAHMKNLVRPLNFYSSNPGKGFHVIHTEKGRLGIVNLIGRVFMGTYDCPFRCISDFLPTVQDQADAFFIDFHAETTSEKQAMGWFLDGKVAAVVGTHTHVQTADAWILPKKTAYLTDVGMVGAADSILGMEKSRVIQRFIDQMPTKFDPPDSSFVQFCAVKMTVDMTSGLASDIVPIHIRRCL